MVLIVNINIGRFKILEPATIEYLCPTITAVIHNDMNNFCDAVNLLVDHHSYLQLRNVFFFNSRKVVTSYDSKYSKTSII